MSPEAKKKNRLLQGQDQYNLRSNDSKIKTKLPSIEFGDIFNFLVVQTSFYIGKQMKGYKAFEAYKVFHEWFCYRGEVKVKRTRAEINPISTADGAFGKCQLLG